MFSTVIALVLETNSASNKNSSSKNKFHLQLELVYYKKLKACISFTTKLIAHVYRNF